MMWINWVCHQLSGACTLFRGGAGIKGNDITLCSMGGLNKAKGVNETLVIKKWWGNTYLALMSSRITGVKLTRKNTWYYISPITSVNDALTKKSAG